MKQNQKGFTLAELLIVVAIIAVLVAIAVPMYTTGLEKSREATDIANVRSAFSDVVSAYMLDGKTLTIDVVSQQRIPGWQVEPCPTVIYQADSGQREMEIPATTAASGVYAVTVQFDSSGNPEPVVTFSN